MMSDDMRARLKHFIVDHEDYRQFPYLDIKGNITIGIGYNLSARGLSDNWINDQFEQDVDYFYNQLDNDFPWFAKLNFARQIVLIDMCFMGYRKFKEFVRMLDALEIGDYKTASQEMLNSMWALDVRSRAIKDAKIMLTGEF